MKHAKTPRWQRLKLPLMAVGMALLGAVLVLLSVRIRPESVYLADKPTATTSAPATQPASAPAPTDQQRPIDPRAVAARNMSGVLLLFGLMGFTVSGTCIILLVIDIRRSRPAWKTQTRYPRRR